MHHKGKSGRPPCQIKNGSYQTTQRGLQINAQKSFFCAIETEYLGYTLTHTGIKPQQKKVQTILMIQPPTNVKDLRKLIGMVQYYRDLWARCSKVLVPLTSHGRRVWSHQGHQSQQDKETSMVLGHGASKSLR